ELGQQLSGCFDAECVIEIGKMAGAKYMVAGRVSKSGSGYYLSVRIIDVETSKLMANKDKMFRTSDIFQILEGAPGLVDNLMQQFTAKKGLELGGSKVTVGFTKLGRVKLTVSEPNVQLIIDGESRGYIPKNIIPIQLTEGIHDISVYKDGFKEWTESINVIPNTTIERNVQLEQTGESVQTVLDWAMLTITTQPENAVVIIDGIEYGQTYFAGDVTPGKHTLMLSKPLYYDFIKEIELSPGDMLNLDEVLKPNFGSVAINTNPPGATITINDKIETVKTPHKIARLSSGRHTLKLTLPEYRDYETTILIDDEKESVLDIELVPAFGYLNLSSIPSEAEVMIGEKVIGKTPIKDFKLMSGEHLINVRADYYKEVQEIIIIEDGKTLDRNIDLPPNFGRLSVQAAPEGSKIYIDGKFRGNSPAVIEPIMVGSHKVVIDNGEHYKSEERTVFIGLDQTEVIQTSLKELVGQLIVSTNPPGAKIIIDGEYYKLNNGAVAKTPMKLSRVWAGKRTITFDMPGYSEGETEVNVKEDQINVVKVTLDKIVFIKPRINALWRSALLPGFGQYYEGRYAHSAIYLISEAALLTSFFNLKDTHRDLQNEYDATRLEYENLNGTVEEIRNAWENVEQAYEQMDNNYNKQQLVAGAMLGVYLWNVIDSWIFMPKIEEKKIHSYLYKTPDGIGINLGFALP
ncbi:MAG: PEGA domain-containing protein, partial [Candidatus Marinimicrobia bacterium]|nr:PEGA domain-containing protein [Candidatus Neomarinimicrobiota bacterium]